MCAVNCLVSDLCREIAEAEWKLENRLAHLKPYEAEAALDILRRRGDTWAERILLEYLAQERYRHLRPAEPAPLSLDEVPLSLGKVG